jgi:opacity protein-like surface antigen
MERIMKIARYALAASAVFCASWMSSDVQAQDMNNVYFKPEVAYVLPVDGEVDDSVFVGAKVGYELDDNWAAELESGWMQPGWDATDRVRNLDVDVVPVLGNLRYGQRCSDEEIGWYGYGGLGWAFNHLETNSLQARADGSFAWQLGAGVEIPVATNLDVFLDVRYLWNRANVDVPNGVDRVSSDDIVLSSVLFTAGVKF